MGVRNDVYETLLDVNDQCPRHGHPEHMQDSARPSRAVAIADNSIFFTSATAGCIEICWRPLTRCRMTTRSSDFDGRPTNVITHRWPNRNIVASAIVVMGLMAGTFLMFSDGVSG